MYSERSGVRHAKPALTRWTARRSAPLGADGVVFLGAVLVRDVSGAGGDPVAGVVIEACAKSARDGSGCRRPRVDPTSPERNGPGSSWWGAVGAQRVGL